MSARRWEPMPVKYWSRAGLMLTAWCSARCACCYLGCGPDCDVDMDVEAACRIWGQLRRASPHGCRIHLTGGEPFRSWQRLLAVCRRASAANPGSFEKVETNAFWAVDDELVRRRLRDLDATGMARLVISADPYHQQFIPIERCRRLARIAGGVLGRRRVRVRWWGWLAEGFDTAGLDETARQELFVQYAARGRVRLAGRAAGSLAPSLPGRAPAQFADRCCSQPLLRAKHVHVSPEGAVMPGTCGGIVLGWACCRTPVAEIWAALASDRADRPILTTLACAGPVGLMHRARGAGFIPAATYASPCHLCWDTRRFMYDHALGGRELGPGWIYSGGPGRARPNSAQAQDV